MTIALLFPGQGSQSIGMLAELASTCPEVEATFSEASSVLGYDLWDLCQNGPVDDLNATHRTQPAMLAAGIATWRAWKAAGGSDPDMAAGHSLGEYTALVVADALDFKDAVDLVRFRGECMQDAVPVGTGAMAAIIGLDDNAVRAACLAASAHEVVEAVNFNAPGQVVIAGAAEAVGRAIEECKENGAKRAIPLPVSVPSHCQLMKPAAERLGERLAQLTLGTPTIPVFQNVYGHAEVDLDEIRSALKRQLHSPVLWVDTVRTMISAGADRFLECGPGKVLAGLNRRIERSAATHALIDQASIDDALSAMGET